MEFKLKPGEIYIPKRYDKLDVFFQVGIGCDCGFFIGSPQNIESLSLKFRIVVSDRSVKRDWKKVGESQIHKKLSKIGVYSEKDIGFDSYYKVYLDKLDNRIEINISEYKNIEPLAVWDTIHIINRIENNI